jgi:Protein of unknown function (DUF2480)
MDEITNRVENSSLVQVSLDDYYPQGERTTFDIENLLTDGFVLVEKDFREGLKKVEWNKYQDQFVAVICSADAIVPLWAFMLAASYLKPIAKKVVFGDLSELEKAVFNDVLSKLDFTQFQDKNVIVKGCGKHPIPESVYVDFSVKLQPYAKNIMFGEACSAVPLYKKPK